MSLADSHFFSCSVSLVTELPDARMLSTSDEHFPAGFMNLIGSDFRNPQPQLLTISIDRSIEVFNPISGEINEFWEITLAVSKPNNPKNLRQLITIKLMKDILEIPSQSVMIRVAEVLTHKHKGSWRNEGV